MDINEQFHRRSLARRKVAWRHIGLRCLRRGNVKGFHVAYNVARGLQ